MVDIISVDGVVVDAFGIAIVVFDAVSELADSVSSRIWITFWHSYIFFLSEAYT